MSSRSTVHMPTGHALGDAAESERARPPSGIVGAEWEDGAMDAIFHTSKGDITVELFPNHAPKTVKSFVGLATGEGEWTDPRTGEKGEGPLYNGTVFHRVISGFMIQGGDPLGTGTGGPGYDFDDEIHPELHFREPYVLAMANAGKRMGRGTNGSQFFITVGPTPHLQGKHTIFGKVKDAASSAVVDEISTVPTQRGDRPVEDVVISSIEIVD
jgi:peptidyl-prolyl cis-trans isomerase A (cyclophilin A)